MSNQHLQAKITRIDGLLDRLEVELQKVPADPSKTVSTLRDRKTRKNQMAATIAKATKSAAKKTIKSKNTF